jgi:hypothetical protein|tara:strand:+ start:326 stop:643 length:318 start_codon:yes stop_codon:yes gene_type:complete
MKTNRLGKLTLVTAPSITDDRNETFCIINFSQQDQDKFSIFLNQYKTDNDLTVYVVDSLKDKTMTLKWLTDVIEKSHTIILSSKNKIKILKTNTDHNLLELFNER